MDRVRDGRLTEEMDGWSGHRRQEVEEEVRGGEIECCLLLSEPGSSGDTSTCTPLKPEYPTCT